VKEVVESTVAFLAAAAGNSMPVPRDVAFSGPIRGKKFNRLG
jgi:hypothetical protein